MTDLAGFLAAQGEAKHRVTTAEDLEALVLRVKAAQAKFATFTQKQVDHIFRSAALAAADARIPLDELKYWSVDLQEAYATPAAVLQRHYPEQVKS